MIDLIKLVKSISETELERITQRINFAVLYNAEGAPVQYKTHKNNPLHISITLKDCIWQITIIVSLHKYYFAKISPLKQWINYLPFSYSNMLQSVETLVNDIGINLYNAIVKSYEIGLNLATQKPPFEYLAIMQKTKDKILLDDSFNYNFEKITARNKNVRIFYKIYDKTHEVKENSKKDINNILRVELVKKRMTKKETLQDVSSLESFTKVLKLFVDAFIIGISFKRGINAKGLKQSQIDNIKLVQSIGAETYESNTKTDYKNGTITKKQYETRRKFINAWKSGKYKDINEKITDLEREYKTLIISELQKNAPYGVFPKKS